MIYLNLEQERLVEEAVDFYKNSSEQVFQFTGPPGTGKSITLFEILRRLHLRSETVAPMAYTGAAALVMKLKGFRDAKTIHSWLYEPYETPLLNERGEKVMDSYFNRPIMVLKFRPRVLKHIKLIVFDEGWMVPMSMRKDIMKIGAKVIVAGDPDQLPPVEDAPAFFTTGKVHHLTQIMRQEAGSPIIYLAQRAIKEEPIHTGSYGNVMVITEDELTDDMIRMSPVVLCGKNITRDRYNKHIREDMLGFHGNLPWCGEKLICRHNNWGIEQAGISLTNGLTGIVTNAPDVGKYDGKNFLIDFVPDIAADILFKDVSVDYRYMKADKAGRDSIKNSGFYTGNLMEFGYTQTVHLAQGSQWPNGIYIEEWLNRDINKHLNYTAITRFANMAIYVKPKRKFAVSYAGFYY